MGCPPQLYAESNDVQLSTDLVAYLRNTMAFSKDGHGRLYSLLMTLFDPSMLPDVFTDARRSDARVRVRVERLDYWNH